MSVYFVKWVSSDREIIYDEEYNMTRLGAPRTGFEILGYSKFEALGSEPSSEIEVIHQQLTLGM